MLPLFIFMNRDLLDSPPVGISHTCPHNLPAIPVGKRDKHSDMTKKMCERGWELGQLNVFYVRSNIFVCAHATQPIKTVCPVLVYVSIEQFPQLPLKPTC